MASRQSENGNAGHGHSAERAYSIIRSALLMDEWPAGTRLLENELAQRIGVSRTPIRDALRRLVNEGFLEYAANVGCRVRGWSRDDIDSIFDLRIELETYAARRAASRIDRTEIDRLAELCDAMDSIVQQSLGSPELRDELTPLNDRFHTVIVEAARNDRLTPLLASVTSAPMVLRTFRRYREEEVLRSMGHHRELVAALSSGNVDWAGAVMRSHIHAGYVAMMRDAGL
ncbi:GntR family transcriptional regulator [Fulvimarina sp. MAC8]|uniref:GntR family transcriptional regulator n=1 Tax=Fulvimarina sp. MAC8 TaxID=3162874 RepID=UPI0032F052D7